MAQLDDIRPLSDFQRNTKEHLRAMKRTGHPRVLTVNGRAELVVQDARSYQKLLDLLEEADVSSHSGSASRPEARGKGDLWTTCSRASASATSPRARRDETYRVVRHPDAEDELEKADRFSFEDSPRNAARSRRDLLKKANRRSRFPSGVRSLRRRRPR